jgi:hypothetical protein
MRPIIASVGEVFAAGRSVPALREARDVGGSSVSYGEKRALSQADPLERYISEAQPLHDLLRRGLIQLAGFLLKRTIASRPAIIDYEPVERARERICEAADGLRSLRAPASATHHRSHMTAALVALEGALAAALSTTDPDGDALFHLVQEAERNLRAVGRATPGFETVDLRQACCAMHGIGAPFEARLAG